MNNDGLLNMEENKNKEIDIQNLEQQPLTAHFDYVSDQIHQTSANKALSKEVSDGPPADMWKIKSMFWKKKKSNALSQLRKETAKKREQFFQPSNQYSGEMSDAIDNLPNKNVSSITSAFDGCVKPKEQDEGTQTFHPRGLLNDDRTNDTEFSTLCSMLEALQVSSAETLSSEDAKRMAKEYKGLKRSAGEANCAHYLTTSPNKTADWSAEVAAEDTQSTYLLLYYSVTAALRSYVNQQDPNAIQQDGFSKLCGITMAASIAAGSLCVSEDFKKTRAKSEATVLNRHRQADELEAARIEKENQDKLELKRLADEKLERKRLAEEKLERKRLAKENIERRNLERAEIRRQRLELAELERQQMEQDETVRLVQIENKRIAREAREKLGGERMTIVTELYNNHKKQRSWLDKDGPERIKGYFGEDFYKDEEDFNSTFYNKVIKSLDILNAQLTNIEAFFQNNPDITLGMPMLQERLCVDMVTSLSNAQLFSNANLDKDLRAMCYNLQMEKHRQRQGAFEPMIKSFDRDERAKFWMIPEIQNLVLSPITDTDFNLKIKELTEQALNNEKILKKSVGDNVSVLSEKVALDEVKASLGGEWFLGTPAIISIHLSRIWAYPSIYLPRTQKSEAVLRNAMSGLGLNKEHLRSVGYHLKKNKLHVENPTSLKSSLKTLKDRLDKNASCFEGMIASKQLRIESWRKLHQWYQENQYNDDHIFKSVLTEKLDSPEYQHQYPSISFNQFRYGVQAKEAVENKFKGQEYRNQLCGAALCQWPSLEPALKEMEDSVIASVNQFLHDGHGVEHMPFLKDITTIEDLEKVTYGQFNIFASYLRGNLAECVALWCELNGPGTMHIKRKLLPLMLAGRLRADKFEEAVEKERHEMETSEYAQRLRMLVTLGSPASQVQSVRYQYATVDTKTAGIVKERQKAFEHSKEVWRTLDENDQRRSVEVFCLKQTAKYQKNITGDYRDAMTKLLDINKEDFAKIYNSKDSIDEKNRQAYVLYDSNVSLRYAIDRVDVVPLMHMQAAFAQMQAAHKKDSGSNVCGKCMSEFMLGGNEDILFQKENEGKFTNKDDKVYESTLIRMGTENLERSVKMEIVLKSLVGDYATQANPSQKKILIETLRFKLRKIMSQIELRENTDVTMTETRSARNLERFGVKSMEDLVHFLFENLRAGGSIVMDKDTLDSVALYEKRIQMMKDFKDGAFKPVLEYLVRDKEVWTKMMMAENENFIDYMNQLYNRVGGALDAINGINEPTGNASKKMSKKAAEKAAEKAAKKADENSFFINQFLMEHGENILKTQGTKEQWEIKLLAYRNAMMGKIDSKAPSMTERLNMFIKKHPNETSLIGPYLPQLVMSSQTLFSALLKDDSALNELHLRNKIALENQEQARQLFTNRNPVSYSTDKKTISERDSLMESFLKDTESLSVFSECIITAKQLSEHYEDFLKRVETMSKEQEVVSMEQKEKTTLAIEARIQRGMTVDALHKADLANLRSQLYEVESPIRVILGEVKAADAKSRQEQLKIISNKFPSWDPLVQNLLAERQTSTKPLDENALATEGAWLVGVHAQAKTLTENDKPLSAQRLEQLTLYCYTHMLRGEKITDKEIPHYLKRLQGDEKLIETLETQERKTHHSMLKAEITDTINCLKMGKYTLNRTIEKNKSKIIFKDMADSQSLYFVSAEFAYNILDEELEQWQKTQAGTKEDKDGIPVKGIDKDYLKTALMEYLREDIRRGVRSNDSQNAFRKYVQERLHDKSFIKILLEGKQRKEEVAGNLLNVNINRASMLPTQQDMEQCISQYGPTKLKEKYNALNAEQRQIFAIALTMPNKDSLQGDVLSDIKIVRAETGIRNKDVSKLRTQLNQYITHGRFQPEINYSQAVGNLWNTSNGLNEEAFNQALQFVQYCISRYEENTPKNWEQLGDSASTIAVVANLNLHNSAIDSQAKLLNPIKNVSDFLSVIKINDNPR